MSDGAEIFAAFIALSGVIATFLYGGYLQRLSVARTLDNKRAALRAALRSEFKSIASMARAEIDVVKDEAAEHTWIPVQDFLVIPKATIEEIGLLTPWEVDLSFDAYHTYVEQIGYIARFSSNNTRDEPPHANKNIPFRLQGGDRAGLRGSLTAIAEKAEAAAFALEEAAKPVIPRWAQR